MKVPVEILYQDGSNYKFNNTIEVEEALIAKNEITVNKEVDITELGITINEWMNPKYREGFHWNEDDHSFVTVVSVNATTEIQTV